MKRERIVGIVLIVTAVFTFLFTSLVIADSPLNTTQPDNLPSQKEVPPTATLGGAVIILTKTVGIMDNCADTQTITAPPGTAVTYCYTVTNIGAVSLTRHDLVDSESGMILNDFPFVLIPGASAFLTQSVVLSTTTINTATWTAYNPGPIDSASSQDAATVIAHNLNVCRFPNQSIPDGPSPGLVNTLSLNAAGTIADFDVYLEVDHGWVGDLRFVLEQVSTGITTTLVDRPGVPATTFGCSRNNIQAIIDDEANAHAETACTTPIALFGPLVGGDPPSNVLLTIFDGTDLSGQWRLHVSDHAAGDTGTLRGWCLLPTLAAPTLAVTPDELAYTQPLNTQVVHPLTLQNDGNASLTWAVHESAAGVTAVAPQPAPFISRPATAGLPFASAAELVTDVVGEDAGMVHTAVNASIAAVPTDILYDNGPLVNMPGGGAGGADASALQDASLGMSVIGFGHQAALNNAVADDFTVTDANGWYVDTLTFYAYQTNSPLTSTITAVNYRIWDGPPNDPGSNILFYPTLPNQLLSTAWSGIYRVLETGLSATNRPIMQNTAHGGFILPPGNYWLEWQTHGSLASGPWAPPITINSVITTGNGLQFLNPDWYDLIDIGQQGLPFVISGHVLEDIPWASVTPASGALPSGTTEVMVTFNTAGLTPGVYTGTLLVAGNDPNTPTVPVPLTLTVELNYNYLPVIIRP